MIDLGSLKNTLIYFIIGAPFALGVVLRFKGFDFQKAIFGLVVTVSVYGAVGVGYTFVHYRNPPRFFLENGLFLFVWSIAILASVVAYLMTDVDKAKSARIAAAIAFCVVAGFQGVLESTGNGLLMPAFAIVMVFCLVGLANAVLGSIAAGFTLSAVAYGIILGDGIDDILFWKEFFEYFEISSAPLRLIIMLGSALLGATEFFANKFDWDL